jgi:hypothetical protein
MGVYRLKAGQDDPQRPHAEDKVYFVGRSEEHRFVDIAEDLTALVCFAPAEGSTREQAGG